jgi:hypothetical protein
MNCLSIMGGAPMALLLVAFASCPVEARHIKSNYPGYDRARNLDSPICTFTNEGRGICNNAARATVVDATGNAAVAMTDAGTVIGARPNDCPHAYCGCGLRKYLGLSDKRLNLASNWARLLPRESGPRPGVAAVRSGHVMYIEAAAGNGRWLIRDYNSGGGLSRMHVRDVRGYVFVNPHGQLAGR